MDTLLSGRDEDDEAPATGPDPEFQALTDQLTAAVAVSRGLDSALLNAAVTMLQRRAAGKAARALPAIPQPPADPEAFQRWSEALIEADAGIWKTIPEPDTELRLGTPDNQLVQTVAKQARLLRASLFAHTQRDSVYEAYQPDPGPDGLGSLAGTPVPAIPGLGRRLSRVVNLKLGRGGGRRVQPGREEELYKLGEEAFAVWDRSRAYTEAVLALLSSVEQTHPR